MRNNQKSFFIVLLLCSFVAALSACGRSGGATQSAREAELQLPDEQQLRLRAQSRWDAILAKDFAAAFSFTTPTYQAAYSPMAVKRYYGGGMKREKATVEHVTVDEDGLTASVAVRVFYFSEFDSDRMLDSIVREKWIKTDGRWWVVQKG